jgi:hypothetical protein
MALLKEYISATLDWCRRDSWSGHPCLQLRSTKSQPGATQALMIEGVQLEIPGATLEPTIKVSFRVRILSVTITLRINRFLSIANNISNLQNRDQFCDELLLGILEVRVCGFYLGLRASQRLQKRTPCIFWFVDEVSLVKVTSTHAALKAGTMNSKCVFSFVVRARIRTQKIRSRSCLASRVEIANTCHTLPLLPATSSWKIQQIPEYSLLALYIASLYSFASIIFVFIHISYRV